MSAPNLADVLAEVNRLRGERDLEPLDAMPARDHSRSSLRSESCPVTIALAVDWSIPSGAFLGRIEIELPEIVGRFIQHFDHGAYPELA